MPKYCTSCQAGDETSTTEAGYYLQSPREAVQKHGRFLCDEHAQIVEEDFEDVKIQDYDPPTPPDDSPSLDTNLYL